MAKKKLSFKVISLFFWILKLFSFLFLPLFLFSLFFFLYYAKDLPRPEVFSERHLTQSTKIYDRSGQILLYEIYGEEKRTWVPLEKIPEHLKQAVILAEDANFYHHFGVDLKGIIRAILIDLKIKKPIFGGSTIPQQLIRSTFLSTKKTLERKTQEVILAIELDRKYSKDQILEWYLNQIPFGQNAYGVEAASETYFGKSVSELTPAESATLAALIRAPYRLSPYDEEGRKELLVIKDKILEKMAAAGFLDQEKLEMAKKEELNFKKKRIEIKAPYFTLWVKSILEKKYGPNFLKEKGLKVITSLDWELQKIAEETVKKGIERNKKFNAYNAALISINPKTGEVLALTVGTGDYYAEPEPEGCLPGDPQKGCLFDPQFNVAIQGLRQPGSAFKPFVYATAFKKGYNDKTIVIDEPTDFGKWGGNAHYTPQNYDRLFRGPVTLRQALAQSLNVPSIKVLLYLAGLEESVKTARDLGITTLKPPFGPAIVLGGWEVKLIEMTSAYGVFATEGLKVEPTPILKIEDPEGNILEENKKEPKRVLEKEVCRLINDILSDNAARAPMFGERSNMYFPNYQVAAKTGTTENFKDGWIIGYTPSIVTGIWTGNNNNTPMQKKPGIFFAGHIFHEYMEKVLPKFPKENFNK